MFDRLSPEFRKVLSAARGEVERRCAERMDLEHLLLGLLQADAGRGARILRSLGVGVRGLEAVVHAPREPDGQGHQPVQRPFTPRLKEVIGYADARAYGLGHREIRTEHLLWALVREPEGVVPGFLRAMGLSDSAMERLDVLVGREGLESCRFPGAGRRGATLLARGSPPAPESSGFSDEARDALSAARSIALQEGHQEVGTLHLLMGVLREADGATGSALRDLGVEPGVLRAEVEASMEPGKCTADRDAVPFSRFAKCAVEESLDARRALAQTHITTGHLLLGLLCVEEGSAAAALRSAGVRYGEVYARLAGS